MRIGFIGLDGLGGPMAARLAAAGHEVTGFRAGRTPPAGVSAAGSALEAAMGAEAVVLMQPDGPAARAAVSRILDSMAAGSILIDASTIDIADTRAIAAEAKSHGIAFLDAPVAGDADDAAAGRLIVMAGGDTGIFGRAMPVFDALASHVHHCGPSGAGQAAKLCHTLMLGVTLAAASETVALADALGLGRKELHDAVSGSLGGAALHRPMRGVGPTSPADRDFAPGLPARQLLEHLTLVQSAARGTRSETPLADRTRALFADLVDAGGGDRDAAALVTRHGKPARR